MADEATGITPVNTEAPQSDPAGQQGAPPADVSQAPESGDSPTSEQAGERKAALSGLFSRFMRGADEPQAASVSDRQAEESAPSPDEAQPVEQQQEVEQPETLTLTQAELDRLVQSRTDMETARRERIAQQRQAEAQRRQQSQQFEQKLREDPIGAAEELLEQQEQVRAAEQEVQKSLTAVTTTVQGVTQQFDQVILSPLYNAVPRDQQDAVYGDGPVGIDGRRDYVERAIKAIRTDAEASGARKAEAAFRRKIQNDPSFRKQLYHEFRGVDTEPQLEPAMASSGGRPPDPLRSLLQSTDEQGTPFG